MNLRTYVVTVTPKHKAYAGSWQSGSYEVEVVARDRSDAIKSARRDYEDGAVNPAKFTAKLKKEEAADPMDDFNYVGSRHHY